MSKLLPFLPTFQLRIPIFGLRYPAFVEFSTGAGGPIDAPTFMPSGSMWSEFYDDGSLACLGESVFKR